LIQSITKVTSARKAVDLTAIKREEKVVNCVTTALTVVAVVYALGRGAFSLDRRAWSAIETATGLSAEAATHTAEACFKYLQVLRGEATSHPVLLILDLDDLQTPASGELADALDRALSDAEGRIHDLWMASVVSETVPSQRGLRDYSCTGLAERIAGANALSVWKLPFFMELAILQQCPNLASDVTAMMDLAVEQGKDDAVRRSMSLLGLQSSAMIAALAGGPIGIALALTMAIYSLGSSIKEYEELQTLYQATLDPTVLLRGLDHEEASRVSIIMDLIGLIVW
jgi:hypothetical protein